MKKSVWILLAVIMSSYTACHWDYHLSNYLFKKYCSEEGRTGLFIYEKVALGDEYFMPFPKDKDPRDLDRRFIFEDNLMINRKRFEKDYIFDVYKSIPLSSIGPIIAVETSVIRKDDQKLLGKAVSLANRKGWWYRKIASFGQLTSETCPSGRDERGTPNYYKHHDLLVKEIMYKN